METRKVAIACFIGGFICAGVTLAVNPVFWWLGLIAGVASGYLAYEFRETLQAVPRAWQSAQRGSGIVWQKTRELFRECFLRPHPCWHLSAGLFILTYLLFWHLCPFEGFAQIGLVLTVSYLVSYVCIGMLKLLSIWGAQNKGYYSVNFAKEHYYTITDSLVSITYRDLLYWTAQGVSNLFILFAWKIWKGTAIGIYKAICFAGRFLKNLFILIHSNKRLLCAIDGAIGGTIARIYLASPAMTIWEKTLLCVFGGVIGAVIGVANHEVVSKRILRVPINGE